MGQHTVTVDVAVTHDGVGTLTDVQKQECEHLRELANLALEATEDRNRWLRLALDYLDALKEIRAKLEELRTELGPQGLKELDNKILEIQSRINKVIKETVKV